MAENHMPIVLADDDVDDQEMMRKALNKTLTNEVYTVADEELLDLLHHRGKFTSPDSAPTPGLILLDLNMPRKGGREALAEIKADPEFRRIPVVVMTTSKAPDDIAESYELGGSSFITKPASVSKLAEVMRVIGQYWFKTVRLPKGGED